MGIFDTLNSLRREFGQGKFDIATTNSNPIKQFEIWFNDAIQANFLDANAMSISTSDTNGYPSSRMVLLKKYDEAGFVFFTNYDSQKGKELEINPYASLLFYWDKLERQIRISGKVEKISVKESTEYFETRAYMSKVGAWASNQSSALPNRFSLIKKVSKLMAKYPKDVPLPPFWGGYIVIPERFEFWQGRKSRLHDRILYIKKHDNWEISRLFP